MDSLLSVCFALGEQMSGLESVPSAYLSIGFLTVVGILMPLTNFIITWIVRPRIDPARPHITKSYLLEGYERDHSLYPRRLTTFECGSEPVGEAMIQFHFQYASYMTEHQAEISGDACFWSGCDKHNAAPVGPSGNIT